MGNFIPAPGAPMPLTARMVASAAVDNEREKLAPGAPPVDFRRDRSVRASLVEHIFRQVARLSDPEFDCYAIAVLVGCTHTEAMKAVREELPKVQRQRRREPRSPVLSIPDERRRAAMLFACGTTESLLREQPYNRADTGFLAAAAGTGCSLFEVPEEAAPQVTALTLKWLAIAAGWAPLDEYDPVIDLAAERFTDFQQGRQIRVLEYAARRLRAAAAL